MVWFYYEREEKYEIQRHGHFLGLQGSGGMKLYTWKRRDSTVTGYEML